jgi:hypothetical protein
MPIENGANVKDVQVRLTNIETTLGTYTHATKKWLNEQLIFSKVLPIKN